MRDEGRTISPKWKGKNMAKLKRFIVNATVCFLLPQLLLAGCSLIGFGLGAMSDSSNRAGEVIPFSELRMMRIGTGITVLMRDSRRIEGDYLGMKEQGVGEYSEYYDGAVTGLRAEGHVPSPGDSVTFALRNTPWLKERGKFRGVNPGAMVVNQSGRRVFVSDLNLLTDDSCANVDLSAFSALVREEKLPLVTKSILLEVTKDTTELPAVDIVQVEITGGARVGKFIGLGIGAAIDAIAIAAYTQSCREDAKESCNGLAK